MILHNIRLLIISALERRAYKLRNKSLSHLAHWAKLNTRKYYLMYPNAIRGAW